MKAFTVTHHSEEANASKFAIADCSPELLTLFGLLGSKFTTSQRAKVDVGSSALLAFSESLL